MEKNKLFNLFKRLSLKEIRDLDKFVRSPFHNQRTDVIQLFDLLRDSSLEKVEETDLYQQIFPSKPFHKKTFADVKHYLLKVIEDYFAIQVFQKERARKEFYIAKAALSHGQKRLFHQKIKKAETILKQKNLEYQVLLYEIEMAKYEELAQTKRDESVTLKVANQYVDTHVIIMQLQQGYLKLAHNKVAPKVVYDHKLLNLIIKHLESSNQKHLLEKPLIALHYFSYKMLKEGLVAYFEKLTDLLKKYSSQLSIEALNDFYANAINFGIQRINSGQRAYIQKTFDLYLEGLSLGLFVYHRIFSPFHYKNI